jgi:hypothetical protein
MRLPKPVKKSAPRAKKKKAMAATMHDLKHGAHHGERTHKQEVAIGLKQSGQDKKDKKPSKAKSGQTHTARKKTSSDRRKRNKGRS